MKTPTMKMLYESKKVESKGAKSKGIETKEATKAPRVTWSRTHGPRGSRS